MVFDSISALPDEMFAGKEGSLKLKELVAFSFVLLAAEADRAGLAPLAQLNAFKVQILTEYIRGETDLKKARSAYEEKIEKENAAVFRRGDRSERKHDAFEPDSGLDRRACPAHRRGHSGHRQGEGAGQVIAAGP